MRAAEVAGLLFVLLGGGAWAAPPDSDPLEPLPAERWTLEAAGHLLRRAGFGGTPDEVRALHALGLEGAVDRLLDWEGKPDPDLPPLELTVTARPTREEFRALATQEERQKLNQEYRRRDRMQFLAIREWWIHAMVRTAHPLRERLTLFWHGHFTSGYRDVRNSYHMWIQNTLFRRHAAGNFRTLLHAISRDPAMLEYLDNNRNRKQHPNENYAREVMELFTLGVGHYDEHDVQEAARALTGWTFSGNRFVFARNQHDGGEKEFLGRRGNFGGEEVLDIILEQPAAARHLAGRLFRAFAHADPDDAVLEALARSLRRHDWELRPVLHRLLLSRAFHAPAAVGTRIKSPVELLVGLHRSLGMRSEAVPGLSAMAASLGQALLDPPNVKGWPGGRDWITTSHLLNRYNLCGAIVGLPQDLQRSLQSQDRRLLQAMRLMQRMRAEGAMGMEPDMQGDAEQRGGVRGRGRGRRHAPPVYDVVGAVRAAGLADAAEVVDHFTGALLARPPTDAMRATLIAALERDGGIDLRDAQAKPRLHAMLRLVVSTPEFQLN